jgi:hypothetical protein
VEAPASPQEDTKGGRRGALFGALAVAAGGILAVIQSWPFPSDGKLLETGGRGDCWFYAVGFHIAHAKFFGKGVVSRQDGKVLEPMEFDEWRKHLSEEVKLHLASKEPNSDVVTRLLNAKFNKEETGFGDLRLFLQNEKVNMAPSSFTTSATFHSSYVSSCHCLQFGSVALLADAIGRKEQWSGSEVCAIFVALYRVRIVSHSAVMQDDTVVIHGEPTVYEAYKGEAGVPTWHVVHVGGYHWQAVVVEEMVSTRFLLCLSGACRSHTPSCRVIIVQEKQIDVLDPHRITYGGSKGYGHVMIDGMKVKSPALGYLLQQQAERVALEADGKVAALDVDSTQERGGCPGFVEFVHLDRIKRSPSAGAPSDDSTTAGPSRSR